jgi:hypothetical protein
MTGARTIDRTACTPHSRTRDQLVRESLAVSKALCFVAMLFPVLAAAGWYVDIPLLTQGHQTLPPMQPNTAMGLTLGAFAVLLTSEGATQRARTTLALLLASVLVMLGLRTLGEYVFGWNIGIDIEAHGGRIWAESIPATRPCSTSRFRSPVRQQGTRRVHCRCEAHPAVRRFARDTCASPSVCGIQRAPLPAGTGIGASRSVFIDRRVPGGGER